MDGPGHDKECADNDNETYIFAGGMLNPSRTVEGEEVIAAGGRGQERTQFLVMPFPMLLQDERKNCNSDEQNRERREERRRRLHDRGDFRGRLLDGALVFGQEKASRQCLGSRQVGTGVPICGDWNILGFRRTHNCLRPSASGRVDAARLANAVELSADAHWIAFCPVIPYSVDTDNGDGPDTAGIGGRSDFAARKFRASDRFSLWIEHVRRGSRSGRW